MRKAFVVWVEGGAQTLMPDTFGEVKSSAMEDPNIDKVVLAFGGFSGAVEDSLMYIDPGTC